MNEHTPQERRRIRETKEIHIDEATYKAKCREMEDFEIEQRNYLALQQVLDAAYERASRGKGRERHATDNKFEDQPICTELRQLGISPAIFQIRKKALESTRMDPTRAINELLDVIVYAAASVIILSEDCPMEATARDNTARTNRD